MNSSCESNIELPSERDFSGNGALGKWNRSSMDAIGRLGEAPPEQLIATEERKAGSRSVTCLKHANTHLTTPYDDHHG